MACDTALARRESTYSSAQGDDCVQVATLPSAIHVRDSQHPVGPELPSPPPPELPPSPRRVTSCRTPCSPAAEPTVRRPHRRTFVR
ncbi:DUF397 domain-containing protein [Streptomyces sp. NBC_01314]|uniref:DUF397 domain-containing protein n=1 Tax=Streptomyces sp. NBC_01314 TaxID=2903821 RepID=UPI00308E05FD|nr:DUF397 domain-containing protein [Streptomyces sp. NBC_01314]